jgi:hypothetical protein
MSRATGGVIPEKRTVTMGDSMITPSIEYDYLIKFLALGDSGVGKSIEKCRVSIVFLFTHA